MEKDRKYRLTRETWREDGHHRPCYGLQCCGFGIRCISTDRDFVEMLCSLLNHLQAEPERAIDLVEQLLP